ncbi:MAG: hypothetical protein H7839_15290 [Magnetococcus sp. YQC-5]
MESREPLTDKDGEVRELTDEDFRHFRSASSLPASLVEKLGLHGSQKESSRKRITIRISHEELENPPGFYV